MRGTSSRHGRGFDLLLAVPLVAYLLLIVALVGGVFVRIRLETLEEIVRDERLVGDLLHSIGLSLVTSFAATALSVAVAVPAGYLLSRRRPPLATVVDTVLDLPIVLPPLVVGLSVLIFFNTAPGRWLDRGLVDEGLFVYQPLGIVLVQFVVGCAFAVRVLKAGFDSLDRRLEEVAMTLGARPAQSFRKVVLPNVVPSLVAGAVISWARIFGLFGPVLLVCGTMRRRTEIMPTTIFLETSIGRIEIALTIGVVMILISMVTLVAFKRLGGRGYLW